MGTDEKAAKPPTAMEIILSALCLLSLGLAGPIGFANGAENVAMVIGGYGASNSVELVTKDGVCKGEDINPPVQFTPGSSSTWVSEYVDGYVLLCGGQNLDQVSDCYKLEPDSGGRFEPTCPLTEDRKYSASLVHNGEMYVLGGYNNAKGWLDTAEMKPKNDPCFQEITSWKLPRGMYNFCAVAHDNKLYTVGGSVYAFLANSDIGNVDILDMTTNTWTAGEPLPQNRSSPACTVYEHEGEMGILVVGGCDDSCHEHLTDTLFYPFNTGQWINLGAELNTPRMGMKLPILNGKPTVVGGYYTSILPDLEEFDGTQWVQRNDGLAFGRYQYGMPMTLTSDQYSC